MAGRPTIKTPELVKQIILLLRAGSNRKSVAGYVGIGERTLTRWNSEDPDLATAIEQAEEEAILRAEKAVVDSFGLSWKSAAWFLERRRPDLYGQDRLERRLAEVEAKLAAYEAAK